MKSIKFLGATALLITILMVIISGCSTGSVNLNESVQDPGASPNVQHESMSSSSGVSGNQSETPVRSQKGSTAANTSEIKQITAQELNDLLLNNNDLILIDISTPGEFKEGHIRDSMLGDMQVLHTQPEQYLDSLKINKTDTIILICETGNKSYRVADVLMRVGYQNVYNLVMGKIGWVRSGFAMDDGIAA